MTLAEALPAEGSGLSLPLDLRAIASRCTGAFYAPRRFAAVQLAYSAPRCRVLVFHTGRLVGTGTDSSMAARLAIARAQRQLAVEADVHLKIRSFQVINQVGAVALRATLNCDAFAAAHSATSHYDRSSFVGLAWRPPNEKICCEIYSTGRGKYANAVIRTKASALTQSIKRCHPPCSLPGSVAERQLHDSFARMLPELLRFSSSAALLAKIPEEQQAHHRVGAEGEQQAIAEVAAPAQGRRPQNARRAPGKAVDLWAGWGDAADVDGAESDDDDAGASATTGAGLNLAALGL